MPPPLQLTVTDYLDETRWRWVLTDMRGNFLADHDVRLDPTSREVRGFADLQNYLDFYQPVKPPAQQLAELGAWIGSQLFGGLRAALLAQHRPPVTVVNIIIPDVAQTLLFRPFELARFDGPAGRSFVEHGIRFVYQLAAAPVPAQTKTPISDRLRLLTVFSLPDQTNPLNLRRERYQLQQLVRELMTTGGKAVELRVIQYGATRDTLRDALEEGDGWDMVHISGHGRAGELLLESASGGTDHIDSAALADLLRPAQARLKLLILDTCLSAAATQAAARAQLGLAPDAPPTAPATLPADAQNATEPTALPSLAQTLAQELGCAALAMRYPVEDGFATDLMLALYDKLLAKQQPLPAALHLALQETRRAARPASVQATTTPVLYGAAAAELRLVAPQQALDFVLPPTGLAYFEPEPARFVGRLGPMLRASLALAPHSNLRGVFFYGMPGAGKTACALELAYRHEEHRFRGQVWYKAPEADSDISTALFNLMQDIQTQLNAPTLGLTTHVDDPEQFRRMTLPRLSALLQRNSLLLVLDNLETLLTASNQWRDARWGELITALLSHNGPSRVVLTARRLPADLATHPRLRVEAIHALSLPESVLLARELPHLGPLFDDDEGIALLQRTLRLVQGHPKLLELADGLAADRSALAAQVAASAAHAADHDRVLDAFFAATGKGDEGETRQSDTDFVATLHTWSLDVAGRLGPTANLLLQFLCQLEPPDRQGDVVDANWQDFLNRLAATTPAAAAALAEPGVGLPVALAALAGAGLIEVQRPVDEPGMVAALAAQLAAAGEQAQGIDPAALLAALQAQATTYPIHPGVAEAVRDAADPTVLVAADVELGDYFIAVAEQGRETEMAGGSRTVATAGRRGAPYLLRQARWAEASRLLERLIQRESSPATLAFAIPLLRQIVATTTGTEQAAIDAGILANALRKAGRHAEAETTLRQGIADSVAQGNYRLASGVAGYLFNLLMATGRLEEALILAGEKAEYTRRAGLGPWTQLSDEGQRLQVLNALGRYTAVLARVEELRPQMAALPSANDAEETATPWNVREVLLAAGCEAAMWLEHWAEALTFNAEILTLLHEIDAPDLKLARTRFNDYAPLLSLRRYPAAGELLQDCRAVFEAARAITELGAVYSALADLQDKLSDYAAAVAFAQVALRYKYQAGDPESCAGSHHNLANYLAREQADPPLVLAHRLAAPVLWAQIGSGQLQRAINNLTNSDLPGAPPAFAAVVATVEQVEGVRFGELFARLPRRFPDGDAAIAAVWQLVAQAKAERAAQQQALLAQFEPLLQMIAAVANGDDSQRAAVEEELADLEGKGWLLQSPVARVWAGERDAAVLTAGLDAQDADLVRRLLELVGA